MRLRHLLSVILLAGCTSLRDTRLDHRLPLPEPVSIDLSRYRPVQERADGQDPDLALVVAISGGGHRAANFAIGVLLALENLEIEGRHIDLLREVDYLSTSSGGGFAAGLYISSLYDHLKANNNDRAGYSLAKSLDANEARLRQDLRRDYTGTIFEGMISPIVHGSIDGGDFLEKKLNRFILGAAYREGGASITMGNIFRDKENPLPVALPYWVPNATIYENGQRFPFTPGILKHYGVTGCTHQLKSLEIRNNPYRMPLSIGMKASASFPVLFPATTLACNPSKDPLNPYLHLLDGGLSDNMGLYTAMELLKQDPAPRKVLLLIDAYNKVQHPYSKIQRAPSKAESGYRTLSIVLDRDHAQLDENLDKAKRLAEIEGGTPISTLRLGFDDIRPAITSQITDIENHLEELSKKKQKAIKQRILNEINILLNRKQEELRHKQDTFSLYYNARNVFTSLYIMEGEQDLLLEAGQAVVEKNRETIKSIIKN